MPKTICDIIHSNLEKNNNILIVFGINIFDTTGHQVAIQIPSYQRLEKKKQMQHELKWKKNQ